MVFEVRRLSYAIPLLLATAAAAEGPFEIEFEQLSPRVWAGVRPDPPRFPVMGTTCFVIGDEGVVVYDGGGMPVMAEKVIAKIRSLTDRPVTHVIYSHWHGDHHLGTFRFAEEYPGVTFVAHEFTAAALESSRMSYVDEQRTFLRDRVPEYRRRVETGVDSEGKEYGPADLRIYRRIVDDAPEVDREFNRARIIPPDVAFSDRYVIGSGDGRVELRFLGHGNTAGDVVMWLPRERIVATGDIVVLPSPYAFNVPPRAWAATLRAVKDLGYRVLVPGHGPVQRDSAYVDLLIEVAESVADQRDALLAEGRSPEEVQAALDLSAWEERFTGGDDDLRPPYGAWFERPFRAAAMKAITGEPMVEIEPPVAVPFDDERWDVEGDEVDVGEHLGRPSLRLRGGRALLHDVDLRNARVEFDVAVDEERGFAGLVFRYQGPGDFEHLFVRPHRSGEPDASQDQPVFDGSASVRLSHGEGPGTPVGYRPGEWMHVEVVYAGPRADVYIDSETPVLRVESLRREDFDGAIGLAVSDRSTAHFSRFAYTPLVDTYALKPTEGREPATPPGPSPEPDTR